MMLWRFVRRPVVLSCGVLCLAVLSRPTGCWRTGCALPAAGRAQAVGGRTRLVNQIRGLLREYGVVVAQGKGALERALPALLEDGEHGLTVTCLQQAGHYAANLGLVPREHSSGGRQRLGGITKRGNRYLRRLLVQGAWSVLRYADRSEDRLSRWARQVTCLLQAGGSHRQA